MDELSPDEIETLRGRLLALVAELEESLRASASTTSRPTRHHIYFCEIRRSA